MIALLAPILAFQISIHVHTGTRSKADSARADSVRKGLIDTLDTRARDRRRRREERIERREARQAERDSTSGDTSDDGDDERPAKRAPVTPELLASAFRDASARDLLYRARIARLQQDSTLIAYDATAYQRISAGMGFKAIGRDRLIFRNETVARVQWQKKIGAMVEVRGARSVIPIAPNDVEKEVNADVSIPYFPGREGLWVGGSQVVRSRVNERGLVHPLAEGSEAYYRYSTGDSAMMTLPDRRITLRELRVQARRPHWNLIVGSFWFDVASAQVVRAVYRMSEPMNIREVANEEDPKDSDEIPRWLGKMVGDIKDVTIEYGLYRGEHGGQWWLPKLQAAEGDAQVAFMRVPFKLEESFRYASVNAVDPLPAFMGAALAKDTARQRSDSVFRADTLSKMLTHADSLDARARRRRARATENDSVSTRTSSRYRGSLRVVTLIPTDTAKLAHSPELPASIYDSGEEIFGTRERESLIRELNGLYPGLAPGKASLHYGLGDGLLRYNRVEGLSAGLAVTQSFGQGLSGRAGARIGIADWQPNGELSLSRSDGRRVTTLTAYRRLAVANDWGDPLGVGSSLSAILFGREEGFYYRSWGAELGRTIDRDAAQLGWRVFAERQSAARVETNFSVPHVIRGNRFIDNIDAERATEYGVAGSLHHSLGVDPHGLRLLTDLKVEAATGSFGYGRGLADFTVSHGLGRYLDGALTASAGTSSGTVPTQRLFYLGGSQSVRGQQPSPVGSPFAGDAFWMGRAELGYSLVTARPIVFYDVGWAGDRNRFGTPGRPMSGVGVGASFLDGLVRWDLARGIYPGRTWRADLYLEARF
ncbi:MAG: BamA/TamA family outer membrane protein [Gemmatimonadota bacterium]|nr:BamA/TamA family outer membrane protein [Gemmatimonadota bacterium]